MVTGQQELKKLYLDTYIWRLRSRPMRPDMKDIGELKLGVFDLIMRVCKLQKSNPWEMTDLEKVLKSLKKEKCRDPNGLINELFKDEIAGKDLKVSMLKLFNRIKEEQMIPNFMKLADISTFYKGKGSKNDLTNDRGIFIVSTYRSILMRLIYKD